VKTDDFSPAVKKYLELQQHRQTKTMKGQSNRLAKIKSTRRLYCGWINVVVIT